MATSKSLAKTALREQATAARNLRQDKLDVVMLARVHTPQAIAALARGLHDPQHYVACATALLDRAWGKPAQHISSTSESSVSLHLIAARAIAAELPVIDAKPVDTEVNTRLHLSAPPEE